MKSISLILVVFFIFSLSTLAQDTSFAVTSNGNVGIGTTDPGSRLDVRGGDMFLNGGILFTNSSGVPYADNWIGHHSDGTYDWLHIGGITSSGVRRIGLWAQRVYFSGDVGIGTTSPTAKLDVRGNIVTGENGSGGQLYLAAQNSTNEGGELILNGAASFNEWIMDVNSANLRFFTASTSNNSIQMFNDGTGKVDLLVENEIQTMPTGDANMVPIAYASVASDGTIRTVTSTSNVTLSSHSAGSGNYYFTIDGWNVSYLTTVCIATLNGSSGEIFWNSSGGGATLGIYTRNSTGTAQDKEFTFVVYKK